MLNNIKFKNKFFIVLMILAVILVPISQANTTNSIDIDMHILNDGSADVTEIWDYTSNENAEIYHGYKNLGKSKIINLSVQKDNVEYETIKVWNVNASKIEKSNKCGIETINDGLKIHWGIGEYGRHTYEIKYTITNFVAKLNDSQMVYWELISKNEKEPAKKAHIKIYADVPFSNDMEIHGYGKNGLSCYMKDGYIEMTSNGTLASDEFMTILAKVPQDKFNITNNSYNKNFKYYLKLANSKYTGINKIGGIILSGILLLVIITIVVLLICRKPYLSYKQSLADRKNYKKIYMKNIVYKKYVDYYYQIPCDDVFDAYYIGYNYNLLAHEIDLIGAVILKWIKEKRVRIERKKDICLVFEKSTIIPQCKMHKCEKIIYKLLRSASRNNIIGKKEIEKLCHQYHKIYKCLFKIKKFEFKKLLKDGRIIKKKNENEIEYEASDEMYEQANKLGGLRKAFNDSNLKIEDNGLYEDYLIYSQLLGILEKKHTKNENAVSILLNSRDVGTVFEAIKYCNKTIDDIRKKDKKKLIIEKSYNNNSSNSNNSDSTYGDSYSDSGSSFGGGGDSGSM